MRSYAFRCCCCCCCTCTVTKWLLAGWLVNNRVGENCASRAEPSRASTELTWLMAKRKTRSSLWRLAVTKVHNNSDIPPRVQQCVTPTSCPVGRNPPLQTCSGEHVRRGVHCTAASLATSALAESDTATVESPSPLVLYEGSANSCHPGPGAHSRRLSVPTLPGLTRPLAVKP